LEKSYITGASGLPTVRGPSDAPKLRMTGAVWMPIYAAMISSSHPIHNDRYLPFGILLRWCQSRLWRRSAGHDLFWQHSSMPSQQNAMMGQTLYTFIVCLQTSNISSCHFAPARVAMAFLIESSKQDGGRPGTLRRHEEAKRIFVQGNDARVPSSYIRELGLRILL
jgi:hypothetical protein